MMDIAESAPQDPAPEMDLIEEKPIEDEAEARRARRAAILAKFQSNNPQSPVKDAILGSETLDKAKPTASGFQSIATPPPSTPYNANTGAAPSPAPIAQPEEQFLLSKQPGTAQSFADPLDTKAQIDGGVEGVAAADYDPSQDMREDVRKAAQLASDAAMADADESEYEEEENEDDIDDMFAIIDDEAEKKPKKKKKKQKVPVKVRIDRSRIDPSNISVRNIWLLSQIQWTRPLMRRDIIKSSLGRHSMVGGTKSLL